MILANWQKVIFRNVGMIKEDVIESVLGAPKGTVAVWKEILGLEQTEFLAEWKEKGFVTIIRQNWDLLPREQIAALLEIDSVTFDTLLSEYDFLDVKLGMQPPLNKVVYSAPGMDEVKAASHIGAFTRSHFISPSVKPFDFYHNTPFPASFSDTDAAGDRFASPYSARYSGTLDDETLSDYPENYLKRLKDTGTTGIWIQETLRHLADFPFDRSFSKGYKNRVRNLRRLTERCREYGLDVYLYLNEPRSVPASFFQNHQQLCGQKADDGTYCLCTSAAKVQEYLYQAVFSLAKEVPLLRAVMTITMSENPTHCFSRPWNGINCHTDCPRCRNKRPEEVCAELNNLYAKALHDGNGYTTLIANLWGWSSFMGWKEDQVFRGIDLLSPAVDVLCVSEYSKKFTRGGVASEVIDYSISVPGPSEITEKILLYATERGHRTWAKIQINNSWECSAVPYLPVFDLMTEHIRSLKVLGVSGFMLGWSLGGYPGGALQLCNLVCGNSAFEEKRWYKVVYEENANTVQHAISLFSHAFSNFPFSIDSLYFGGQTLGPANQASLTPQHRKSTMVCFTYDDYENYTEPYGIDIYLSQYEKLIQGWKTGLFLLESLSGNPAFEALKRVSRASLVHFESAYLLAKIAKYKRIKESDGIIRECFIRLQGQIADLYALISCDATIGFEMTNHYYYSANLLLERLYEQQQFI